MAKLKLDKESLQKFFLNHVEKIVFSVVLLLFVLLVYSGSQREGIDKTPDLLANDVSSAQNHVVANTWEQVAPEFPPDQDHKGKLEKGRARTTETFYVAAKPYGNVGRPPAKHRSDPELLAPVEPEARAMVGGLVMFRKEGEADAWADIANMKPKIEEAPKKRAPKKKKTRSAMGESISAEGMMGEDESMEASMPSGMSMMPAMDSASAAGTTAAVLADAKKFPGYRPASVGTMSGNTESPFIVKSFNIVAVVVKVPYQQQWDAFQKAFEEAEGYQPQRDVPIYFGFQSQRAEVPADPNTPLVWVDNWTTEKIVANYPKYGLQAFPGEVADPLYVQPGILTMPLLPIVNRDLAKFAMHSKIPMKETTPAAIEAVVVDKSPTLDLPTDVESLPTADPASKSDPTKSGTRPPGAVANPMLSQGGAAGMMSRMAPGMSSAMGYGAEGGAEMGMSMGMNGMGGAVAAKPSAEFLMVRFFDFIPMGKKFVYRVRVVLQDPNHPYNPIQSPRDQILAEEVKQRLAAVMAKETEEKNRIYSIMTPWSEPSNAVSADLIREAYAGSVTAPRTTEISVGAGPKAVTTGQFIAAEGEHKAKVMSVVWDPTLVTDVPAFKDVMRGTFLNFQQNVDLIQPLTLTFKTVDNKPIAVDQLVVDLRGGDALPGVEGETLVSLGETAFFDSQGNLLVRNELDDWEVLDRYSPPVQAAAATPAMGSDSAAGAYGMEGMEQMMKGGRVP